MGTPVRVNEDNYIRLQAEAEETGRSATNMLNRILDTRYGRGTEGNLTQYPVKEGVPEKTGVPPKISDLITPEKIASEANASGVSVREQLGTSEFPCCLNDTQPCKHWVWDVKTGDGYINILSGRRLEVE